MGTEDTAEKTRPWHPGACVVMQPPVGRDSRTLVRGDDTMKIAMDETGDRWPWSERVGRQVASWSCLVGGVVLLAMSVLSGPWAAGQLVASQHAEMAGRLEQIRMQLQAYERCLDSLRADDPVALNHLAYHYLHLKPAGVEVWSPAAGQAEGEGDVWSVVAASARDLGPADLATGQAGGANYAAEGAARLWVAHGFETLMSAGQHVRQRYGERAMLVLIGVGGLALLVGLRMASRPRAERVEGGPAGPAETD